MTIQLKKGPTKKDFEAALEKIEKGRVKNVVDWSKYCGIIKLKEDPIKLQKKWRNEWK